jgi:hypothetical protein
MHRPFSECDSSVDSEVGGNCGGSVSDNLVSGPTLHSGAFGKISSSLSSSAAAGIVNAANPSLITSDGSTTLKSRLKGKSDAAKKVPWSNSVLFSLNLQ